MLAQLLRLPPGRGFSRGEVLFVAAFAAALAAATSIPYILGNRLPFPHSRFNQALTYDSDVNVYFAFMRQAQAGHWLFDNPFTPEPHGRIFFNLEWLATGKIATLLHIPLAAAYQAERIVSIFLLCFAFYWLASFFFATKLMRRFVFALAMLGGGFGWIPHAPGVRDLLPHFTSADIFLGLHPFFWMLFEPHFLLAQALSVLAITLFLCAEETTLAGHYFLAGLLLVLAGAVRPHDLLCIYLAVFFYILVSSVSQRPPVSITGRRCIVLSLPVPLVAYYFLLFHFHPVFQWWPRQGALQPPRPVLLAAGLGITLFLFLFGIFRLARSKENTPPCVLMICWVFTSLLCLYSYPLMRYALQFITTLLIPALLIGTSGLEEIVAGLAGRRWLPAALVLFVVVNSMTSAVLLRASIGSVARGEHRTSAPLLAAYQWLDAHSPPREVVLASVENSNRLPRYTHDSVFCGSAFNTVGFRTKSALVNAFFQSGWESGGWRERLLREYRIGYVLVTPGDAFPPHPPSFLVEVFRNEAAQIFKAQPAP